MKLNHQRAFTLVEVVLAVGTTSVAVISLMGMLCLGVTSNRESGQDTTIAGMSTQVLSEMRSTPFTALWQAEPEAGTLQPEPTSTTSPEPSLFYFTHEGARQAEQNSATYYTCTVGKTPEESTRNPGAGAYQAMDVRLVFTWVNNSGNARERQEVHAKIARY
jgi:uncharacterized protein (TIGR02598 family)